MGCEDNGCIGDKILFFLFPFLCILIFVSFFLMLSGFAIGGGPEEQKIGRLIEIDFRGLLIFYDPSIGDFISSPSFTKSVCKNKEILEKAKNLIGKEVLVKFQTDCIVDLKVIEK